MDYLQRDAYYTGVSYGRFDMERIMRVMRPRKNGVVIKESGMHAVEHYIMSRYQMYLQIYLHPVSRSAEVVLNNVLKRVKVLWQEGYHFKQQPKPFEPFFKGNVELEDYIALDESIMLAYFQFWMHEDDAILSDLSRRFINRRLFQYVNLNPLEQKEVYSELRKLFTEAGIDPNYYLVHDSTSDLPYDFYRPGIEGAKKPIYLLMQDGQQSELSEQSQIVEAIAGHIKVDHKVYYPEELFDDESIPQTLRNQIQHLLEQL